MMTGVLKERLQRVLGRPKRPFAPPAALKLALLGSVVVLIGLLAAFADHSPDLAHLRVSVLSASPRGLTPDVGGGQAMNWKGIVKRIRTLNILALLRIE
jgi:hypothetical protein